ncbi:MAG: cold shock domain-containing protein [Fimbriimonadaceae bacterium]|nr:cold shock domain-containing protein [Fimbriimonadaceae bacterium]
METGGETLQLGVVKFYNPRKGYGFVSRATGNDVFFHLTHFRTPTAPAPGNVVRFLLGQNREGLTAEEIQVVGADELECFEGTITELDTDGGRITTPDNFTVTFLRGDYIPHTRADNLRVGDEVEMHFLEELPDGGFRAKVVRDPDYQPEAVAPRPERREVDEEEENRRLLGILYKTDLDDEATTAAATLVERNMRATLSALVSRIFDRRLSRSTRAGLVALVPQVYFDEECQAYLGAMAQHLAAAVAEEEGEGSPAASAALGWLFDDQHFPVRWSQYLLPFGLTLLRNLSSVPTCHGLLEEPAQLEAAEVWLARVCRHVEQRRSGHGYVLTTALTTFDEIWQRDALQPALQRVLARLLVSLDAEGLANQIYHLRDKVSAAFLPVLLPLVSQHPDLSQALRAPTQSEIFSQWIEQLLRGEGDTLSTATLATVLPLVEEVRANLADDATISRLLRPVTESLTPDGVVKLLTTEDLPERAVWACLRHLDHRGELAALLANPDIRDRVTAWLRRTSERPAPNLPREQEVNTALKLLDSLRGSDDLRGELTGIGQTLFAGIHERVARADAAELLHLLDQFDFGSLPGLLVPLAQRLVDAELDETARRRVLAWFGESGEPFAGTAAALVAWWREPGQVQRISELVSGLEACAALDNPDLAAFVDWLRGALQGAEVGWQDGFVAGLETLPSGAPAARLEGFPILLPQRLFADPADFAPNRFVRLLHRRGMALGVVAAPVPESDALLGRLSGPLAIDERNAIVGTLVDLHGEPCYFEVAQMKAGQGLTLTEGMLLRFSRVAAAGEQPCRYVAFHVTSRLEPADLPLLWQTAASGRDEAVALSAGCRAVELADGAALAVGWEQLPAARRSAVLAALDAAGQAKVAALSG